MFLVGALGIFAEGKRKNIVKKPVPLKGRFIIDNYDHQGKPFFYATDIAQLKELGLPHDDNWKCINVQIGSIFTLHGQKYEVKDVMVCICDDTTTLNPNGFNEDGYGKDYPFNFEVRWYVLRVK